MGGKEKGKERLNAIGLIGMQGPPKFAWDDCISSIRVAPGWRATLYRNDDFNGDRLEVIGDIPNLQLAMGRCDKFGFNDCVTSIRVVRP